MTAENSKTKSVISVKNTIEIFRGKGPKAAAVPKTFILGRTCSIAHLFNTQDR